MIDSTYKVDLGSTEYFVATSIPPAFTGATGNTRGDKDGTQAAFKLFEVIGDVRVRMYGVCTVNLAGAGSIEVGVPGNTACLIAQVAGATDLDAGDLWIDATPAEVAAFAWASLPAEVGIIGGGDIIETSAGTDISAGNIYYVCYWQPINKGGKVIARYPNAVQ